MSMIIRYVKFVFFCNSNFVCNIRILFELRLRPGSVKRERGHSRLVLHGPRWFANQVAQLVIEYLIAYAMQ